MFELCLFDLDDTLVTTSGLEQIRIRGKNNQTDQYAEELRLTLHKFGNINIYDEEFIVSLQNHFRETKFGVFTRSPRSYASVVLEHAFPNVNWDVLICREDVERTKPYGDGIWLAMNNLGIENLDRVLLVGDGDHDVRSAYNAGVAIALDKTSWENWHSPDNWNALNHMPDAVFSGCHTLAEILQSLERFQPELERAMSASATASQTPPRFDSTGKFIPRDAGGDATPFHINSGGRSFSNYNSLAKRRRWHTLSQSIQDNKDSDCFPEQWIATLVEFIKCKYPMLRLARNPLLVTVVPHRPGRKPRLEYLLNQLHAATLCDPFFEANGITIEPELLAYREGVRSNSKEFLNAIERFENVRNHLYIKKPNTAEGQRVLVIDDVCSTGASLIYAGKYLSDAGAAAVTRYAIAMNISDVLPHD